MPPITAAPISPAASPGPKPPRHRASAGDGAAKAVNPMVAAVANANTAFFMSVTFPVLPGTLTGKSGEGFPRGRCTKVASTLSHDGRQMELSRRCIKVLKDSARTPAAGLSAGRTRDLLSVRRTAWLTSEGSNFRITECKKPFEMSYEFPEFCRNVGLETLHLPAVH
jgi:hypothetical protein